MDPKDRRGVVLAVRFKAIERAALDRAARKKGIPVTRYVREAAMRAAARAERK